jgi:small-conductance mechanosensitive channel
METNVKPVIELLNQLQFSAIFFLAIGIFLLAYAGRLLFKTTSWLAVKFPARRLLFHQLATTIGFFIYVSGGLFLVYIVLNPSSQLLLALGGGAAVAIGFSLKDLVASLFAGIILLFDRPFQVGDRVTFGNTYGEITSIGLRAVRLQTLDDNLVTIPNARFIVDPVASGNAGELDMMVVMPFHLALHADIALARDILHETVVTSQFVYLKKPVTIVASEVVVGDMLALRLTAKAYVLDVRYEKAFETDVVLRTTEAFRAHGIARPAIHLSSLVKDPETVLRSILGNAHTTNEA